MSYTNFDLQIPVMNVIEIAEKWKQRKKYKMG